MWGVLYAVDPQAIVQREGMEPGEQRGPTAASYRLVEGEPTVPPNHTSPAAPSKYDSFAPPPVGSMALIDSPLPQLAPPSGREEISVSENTSLYVSFILITVYGMFIKCSPSCSLPISQIFTDWLPLSSDLASNVWKVILTSQAPWWFCILRLRVQSGGSSWAQVRQS